MKRSILILSDYSILFSDGRLSIFDEIVLYKINMFKVVENSKKKESMGSKINKHKDNYNNK